MTSWRLLADIGGTNLRMARASDHGRLSDVVSTPLADSASILDELEKFADGSGRSSLAGLAIAAAGPVEGRHVALTNRQLIVDADAISAAFGGVPVSLFNDLQAVALALPWLASSDLRSILGPSDALAGPRLAINVGTGFGASLLAPAGGGWHAIACEPGHMTLLDGLPAAGFDVRLSATVEDLISGKTLNDPVASARYWNRPLPASGRDAFGPQDSASFVTDFSALLGHVCGNLVLACGAWGGVYLIGSVAKQWCAHADVKAFLAGFQLKGPMTSRMSRVPVYEICAPHPALTGLASTIQSNVHQKSV